MTVMCQIVQSSHGFEGVIQHAGNGQTMHNTGFQPCAEDAEGLMASVIIRNKWNVVPNPINFEDDWNIVQTTTNFEGGDR